RLPRSRAAGELCRRDCGHEAWNQAGHACGADRCGGWPRQMKQRRLEELPALLGGRKVVLANGCFDILHVGHLRYLQGAKALGDVLVVAINSDRSVRAIKDDGRPILDEDERVALVSAIDCVDYVVLFDEPD